MLEEVRSTWLFSKSAWVHNDIVCKDLKPPPSYREPPFYIFSEPPAFAKTFLTILPQWNTE